MLPYREGEKENLWDTGAQIWALCIQGMCFGEHRNPLWDHPGWSFSSWRFWTLRAAQLPLCSLELRLLESLSAAHPASKSFLGSLPLEQILSCFPCSLNSCQRFNLNGSPREPPAWKERLKIYDSCSQKYKPIFTELYKHPILINSSAAFLKSHSKYKWTAYTTEGEM